MKLIIIVLVVVSQYAISAHAAWHLTWADEFNGNQLNLSDWTFQTGCSGWGNNELQCYTHNRHENTRVENGHLVIDARVENYEGHHFTSARLNSRHAWAYGKFEARAKMPHGKDLWPAIWMMPRDSKYGAWAASGEIDIMELWGDKPHEIVGSIHFGGTQPNNIHRNSGVRHFDADLTAGFHTYGLEWDANEIKWFLDGQHYHTENINQNMWSHKGTNPYHKNGEPFDQPFYWILNIAVGGTFFGNGPYVTPAEANHWPKHTMEVDYVRVYRWQ